MFKKVLLFLAGLIVVLAIIAGVKSPEYKISREISIIAPADKIFPHINNPKLGDVWMPWRESDPKVQIAYAGPEFGLGAKSTWTSEGSMGTGYAEIVESIDNQIVKTNLAYTKPMTMNQTAVLELKPMDQTTQVVWSVEGKNNFLFRLIGLFIDVDEIVGKDFEKGLSNLKKITESPN